MFSLFALNKKSNEKSNYPKKGEAVLPFSKFAWIVALPNGCILGYPRLDTLPENVFG